MRNKTLPSILLAAMLVGQVPLVAVAQEASETPTVQTTDPSSTTTTPPSPDPSLAPAPAPAPVQTSTPVATPEVTSGTPVVAPATGPISPTGADSGKYTYNVETGNWESDRYIWNPKTGQIAPKTDSGYYYNPETGRWDTNEYVYRPESGRYELVQPATLAAASAGVGGQQGNSQQSLASALGALFGIIAGDLGNTNTGPGSSNTINTSTENSGFFDLFSRSNVINTIGSSATTGDASVTGNTIAGNALTGAASVVANVLSLLNSAWSWTGGALNFLAKNFFGDHSGDINLNPGTATNSGGGVLGSYNPLTAGNSGTGPDSTNTIDTSSSNDLTVVNRPTGTITNNIDLLAQSGDASVTKNTLAGDATSGDALAVLNLLNFINSSIASGQSFFGMLNFFGSLDGDILFPAGFLTDALQSAGGGGGTTASNTNTGPNSTNLLNSSGTNNVDITNSPQANFNNNINLAAQSGSAQIQGNTTAGSALTGEASTDSNLFNLYNSSILGQNAVLVLVNVGGTWTGQIMNIPAGSNPGTASALLTSGATIQNNSTGPDSTNTVNSGYNNNLTVQNNPTGNIVNNVRAGAISGDATVASNTHAGSATTGDARVVSNVANMFNSQLNLAGWFGILVVNVFGDWNGSVNKDTSAGETAAVGGGVSGNLQQTEQIGRENTSKSSGYAGTVMPAGAGGGSAGISGGTIINEGENSSNVAARVLGIKHLATPLSQATTTAVKTKAAGYTMLLSAACMLIAAILFSLDRRRTKRRFA